MGTKYQHTRHLDAAREARGTRFDPDPPRGTMNHRQRLILIYGGIILFCTFLLVGELYLRVQERAQSATLRSEAVILRIESTPEGTRALIRPTLTEGNGREFWAALTPDHANLREGQRVGVMFLWQKGELSVADVSRVALPDNAGLDSTPRETPLNPEASEN